MNMGLCLDSCQYQGKHCLTCSDTGEEMIRDPLTQRWCVLRNAKDRKGALRARSVTILLERMLKSATLDK